jgi:hypothetical protein
MGLCDRQISNARLASLDILGTQDGNSAINEKPRGIGAKQGVSDKGKAFHTIAEVIARPPCEQRGYQATHRINRKREDVRQVSGEGPCRIHRYEKERVKKDSFENKKKKNNNNNK